jgi:hypothetical protein
MGWQGWTSKSRTQRVPPPNESLLSPNPPFFSVKNDLFLWSEIDNLHSNLIKIWTCFASIARYQETCIWMSNGFMNAIRLVLRRLISNTDLRSALYVWSCVEHSLFSRQMVRPFFSKSGVSKFWQLAAFLNWRDAGTHGVCVDKVQKAKWSSPKSEIRSSIHSIQNEIPKKKRSSQSNSGGMSVPSLNLDPSNRGGNYEDGSSKFYWVSETMSELHGRGGRYLGITSLVSWPRE